MKEEISTIFEGRVPGGVLKILEVLNGAGEEAYAVGGCVRDILLNRPVHDWDITTSAKPWVVKSLFEKTIDTGIAHGTVTVRMHDGAYEVTTYRVDGDYTDGRHPDHVEFSQNLLEDLKRRDFTINAMAYHPKRGLVDAFSGEGDLKQGLIRCVGDPRERFQEDALRILRAARFSAQLGFRIEDQTRLAMTELAGRLQMISAERIEAELLKLLLSDHPERMIDLCDDGLSKYFLPEWDEACHIPQNTPYHCYDVGRHTVEVIRGVRPDKVLRLAALLHDLGKARTRTTGPDGQDHFKGHALVSEKMSEEILKRLRMDNDTMKKVAVLIRYHDHAAVRYKAEDPVIRRLMSSVGPDLYPLLLELMEADLYAKSERLIREQAPCLRHLKERSRVILDRGDCIDLKRLEVNGRDLTEAGVKKGPEVGRMLNRLLEAVLEEPERNNREDLIRMLTAFLKEETGP